MKPYKPLTTYICSQGAVQAKIMSRGRPYLGSDEFITEFVSEKVQEWSEQLLMLADVSTTQPHASFTAFVHEFEHKFQELLPILTVCCNLWKGSFSLGLYLLGQVGLLQMLLNATCLHYLHALVGRGSLTPPPAPPVSFVSLSRSLLPSPT